MTRQFVCKREDIAPNEMAGFQLPSGAQVVVLRTADKFYACDRVCPHQEVNLDEGVFDGEVLTCHQHMWQWKVETGEAVGLAECPLKVYRVEIEGESVYVEHELSS